MFCSKCGTQLPDDAMFCLKCGAAQRSGVGVRGDIEVGRFTTKKHGTYIFTNRRIYGGKPYQNIQVRRIAHYRTNKSFLIVGVDIWLDGDPFHHDIGGGNSVKLVCEKPELQPLLDLVNKAIDAS